MRQILNFMARVAIRNGNGAVIAGYLWCDGGEEFLTGKVIPVNSPWLQQCRV